MQTNTNRPDDEFNVLLFLGAITLFVFGVFGIIYILGDGDDDYSDEHYRKIAKIAAKEFGMPPKYNDLPDTYKVWTYIPDVHIFEHSIKIIGIERRNDKLMICTDCSYPKEIFLVKLDNKEYYSFEEPEMTSCGKYMFTDAITNFNIRTNKTIEYNNLPLQVYYEDKEEYKYLKDIWIRSKIERELYWDGVRKKYPKLRYDHFYKVEESF